MTMEQAVRQEAMRVLSQTHGAMRARELVADAKVCAMPSVAVPEIEDLVLVEFRETAESPLSWVVVMSEEQHRSMLN